MTAPDKSVSAAPVSDDYRKAVAQQRLAADPLAHVFVTANAGAGKTTVLIDRVARLLLAGAAPSSFLCVTYTKAAAAEMQRRLFLRLGAWCVAPDADLRADLQKLLGVEAAARDLPRARALFARALETPGGLKIQTIHAFCERLLARFPIEADAAPGFDIADDVRVAALMVQSRDAVIASDDRSVAEAFNRFATKLDNARLELLLQKLATLIVNGDIDTLHARHGEAEDGDSIRDAALAATPWGDLRRAAGDLLTRGKKDSELGAALAAACEAARDGDGDGAAAFAHLVDAFFTDKGALYSDRPTKSFEKAEPGLARVLEIEADRIDAARARLRAAERAADAIAATTLARALREAYRAAKTRGNLLDFDDLIALSHALLTVSAATPWVLYKLDGGLSHILIDEGQDTSPLQWDLIAPLQEEFFAGAGARAETRTVFAVGDFKQSIYSFQGAVPEQFLVESQKLAQRAAAAGATFVAPNLQMSFRSAPEVLRAVDAAMAGAPLVGDPVGADVVAHVAARAGEPGLVEVWPLAPRPESVDADPWDAPLDMEQGQSSPVALAREIARTVKSWIADGETVWAKDKDGRGVRRPMRAGDVMALVMTRGALFHALIRAFKREGLPVAGADRIRLSEELAVEDCLALIRMALDPADDLSLACVLKGPWLNLTDDDAHVYPLAHGRARGETLHARLMASEAPIYAEARAFVAALVARAGLDPFAFLSWALEGADGAGRSGWARLIRRLGAEARDPVEELLQRALAPDRRQAATLNRFLADIECDSVEVKREMEEAHGAVRVMTVHAAKGLEAPVVILPDTTGPVKDAPENGLILDEGELYWSPNRGEDDAVTAAARAAHQGRAEREHWRLLYVAMTRAQDRLLVCGFERGNLRGGEAAQSWRARVEAALTPIAAPCETPFGDGLRLGAPHRMAGIVATAPVAVAALPDWALRPAPPAQMLRRASPSGVKAPSPLSPRRDARPRFTRGKLIHGLLQRLPEVAPVQRRAAALAWLARQGAADPGALAAEALAVLDDPAIAAAFGPSSRAEAPLAGRVGDRAVNGIVDRLAVSDAEVLALDFKSDRPAPVAAEAAPAPYVLQMALYRAVLQQIFPDRPVRCALVWTERPHLTELPAPQLEAALAAFLED